MKKAKEPWKAGMFCRSTWKSNGLEYEGIIKSIDMLDDRHYAFVQYLGKDLFKIWTEHLTQSHFMKFKLREHTRRKGQIFAEAIVLGFKSPKKQTFLKGFLP